MSTYTKEQLIARISQVTTINKFRISRDPDADGLAMDNELFAIALASLGAEAVAWQWEYRDRNHVTNDQARAKFVAQDGEVTVQPLYTAPPAPVSDEDLLHMAASAIDDLLSNKDRSGAGGWADIPAKLRRAAMLQGAGGNSPVIPDGWVMVPVQPTAEMLQSGIAAHYERSQIQIHDRPAPGPMECAYAAMIAAAPQQEVKNG